MKYADTVSKEDKEKVLDLYYGRNQCEKANTLDRWEIAKAMGGKFTPAQIYAIILADMESENGEE